MRTIGTIGTSTRDNDIRGNRPLERKDQFEHVGNCLDQSTDFNPPTGEVPNVGSVSQEYNSVVADGATIFTIAAHQTAGTYPVLQSGPGAIPESQKGDVVLNKQLAVMTSPNNMNTREQQWPVSQPSVSPASSVIGETKMRDGESNNRSETKQGGRKVARSEPTLEYDVNIAESNRLLDNAAVAVAAATAAQLINAAIVAGTSHGPCVPMTTTMSPGSYSPLTGLTPTPIPTSTVAVPPALSAVPPLAPIISHHGLIPYVHVSVPPSGAHVCGTSIPLTYSPESTMLGLSPPRRAIPIAPLGGIPFLPSTSPFFSATKCDKLDGEEGNGQVMEEMSAESNDTALVHSEERVEKIRTKMKFAQTVKDNHEMESKQKRLKSDTDVKNEEEEIIEKGRQVGVQNNTANGSELREKRLKIQKQSDEALSKQKRMLRNRESAARSRDKQKSKNQELEASIALISKKNMEINNVTERLRSAMDVVEAFLREKNVDLSSL